MGAAARVLSGSVAAWVKIIVMIASQIALVPVFLAHWSVEQYGSWLVIQSIATFANIFSVAHHNYVGNELLRVPANRPVDLGRLLSAALPFSLGFGLLELLLLAALVAGGQSMWVFDPDGQLSAPLLREAGLALLLLSGATYLSVFSTGLYGRVASALGHFPRTAWWGVGISASQALAAGLLVSLGAGLLQTVAGMTGVMVLMHAAYQSDLIQITRQGQVRLITADLKLGWRNFQASLLLGLTYLLGLVRQQGARILVSTQLGVSKTADFSTMRTASNVAMQGIATVVDPVFPEFMGFLRDRRQAAVVGTMAFVWMVVVFLLAPSLVVLQVFAPALFELWTHGKLAFDPIVFALLSVAMMVFALARPADSIVLGNNLLRVQLVTAVSLAAFTVCSIVWLDGWLGLRGVAFVLLVAELVGALVLLERARQWIQANGLRWPDRLLWLSAAQSALCASAVLLIAAEPVLRLPACSAMLLFTCLLFTFFVAEIPVEQRAWLKQRLKTRFLFLIPRGTGDG
jgi:O-antigen/teichoic acid export membrane protein